VSQFRELCEIADRDRSLTDTLKKVLKLSKGWETAREHVYKAVDTDNRMRCARLPARRTFWVVSCDVSECDHPHAVVVLLYATYCLPVVQLIECEVDRA
jgi:hypothetical protein